MPFWGVDLGRAPPAWCCGQALPSRAQSSPEAFGLQLNQLNNVRERLVRWEGGSQGVGGRPLLCAVFVGLCWCSVCTATAVCSVCRMIPGLEEGVKGTSGTCLDLLLTWVLAVPAARMEHGCAAGLAHSSPHLVPEGLGLGLGLGWWSGNAGPHARRTL